MTFGPKWVIDFLKKRFLLQRSLFENYAGGAPARSGRLRRPWLHSVISASKLAAATLVCTLLRRPFSMDYGRRHPLIRQFIVG